MTVRKQSYLIAVHQDHEGGPNEVEGEVFGGFGLRRCPWMNLCWEVDHLATGRHVTFRDYRGARRWIGAANRLDPDTLRLDPDDPRWRELRELAVRLGAFVSASESDEALRAYAAIHRWDLASGG